MAEELRPRGEGRERSSMDLWRSRRMAMDPQQMQRDRDARSGMFNQDDAAYSPEVDPRLGEMAGAAEQQASDFRNNLELIQRQRGEQEGEGVRRNLAESMAGIRGNYSSRGLLYGGMARGAEGQARAGAANEMLAAQANVNEQARQQAGLLESNAYSIRDQQRRLLQARKDALYNRRMGMIEDQLGIDTKDMQNAQAAGQAAGAAAGSAAAYANQPKQQPTTTTTKKTG